MNRVVVLAGVTGIGKSDVALQLCKSLQGEIIVADSIQIRSHMSIGANRPTPIECAAVRHHMLNHINPMDDFSAGDYVRAVQPLVQDILSRNKTPVFVGGNTLWIDWLINGIPDAPPMNPIVRQQAADALSTYKLSVEYVSQYSSVKPKQLARNDWYRLERCLEIGLSGEIVPSHFTSTPEKYFDTARPNASTPRSVALPDIDMRCLFLMDDRHVAYRLIDKRCEAMVRAGLFDEVAGLLIHSHITPSSVVAKAVGYKEVANEALHWIKTDRPTYKSFLDMQVDKAKAFKENIARLSYDTCINEPTAFNTVYTGQNYFYRACCGSDPKVDMRRYLPFIPCLREVATSRRLISLADAARSRIESEAPRLINDEL